MDTAEKRNPGNVNPWNGLRTYVEGEVIYGRSDEIRVLSLLVMQNSQTVVYGRSGIGKSSLLNAGIFPLVRNHSIFPVYVRFEHNVDKSYLDQIKEAVQREIEKSGGDIEMRRLMEPAAEETLWEFFYGVEFTDRQGNILKPLVVFDQFEEIFTLETNKGKRRRFFAELAGLINNVMPESALARAAHEGEEKTEEGSLFDEFLLDASYGYKQSADFHLVFTLREDFLSYFERNTTDIPSLKHSRYSLHPINEEQAAEIIMKPRPGLVAPEVAKLIIEKVTGEKDFDLNGVPQIQVDSAILSLYLSRLYEKMQAEGADTITSNLVETHSDNIIEDFYSDAIEGLKPETIEWLEDTLINKNGRRDNRDRTTVIRESGLTEEELDRLIYDVKLLRQFSYGGDLRVEYIHDVLCPVISERRARREENRRISFIEDKARIERRKSRRRLVTVVFSFLAIAIIILTIWLINSYQNIWTKSEYYADFRLEEGWPVGVGEPLSESRRGEMPLYYRLSKQGHRAGRFTEVEICSSNTMLPRKERLAWPEISQNENDIRGNAFNDVLRNVKTLTFEAGEDDRISRMVLSDENDRQLLVMSYFHTGPREAWIQYLTPEGKAFTIRDNEIDRNKIGWDEEKRVSSQVYYTVLGNSLPLDDDKVTGFLWQYPEEGTTVQYYLNNYGQPSQEKNYNMQITTLRGDTIITSYARARMIDDPQPADAEGYFGFSRVVKHGSREELFLPGEEEVAAVIETRTDIHGNPVTRLISGKTTGELPPYTVWKYLGDTGLETERRYLTAEKDGKPFGGPEDIYLRTREYTPEGEITAESRVSTNGVTQYSQRKTVTESNGLQITRNELIDRAKNIYLITVDTVDSGKGLSSTAYYGENNIPVNSRIQYGYDTIRSHWITNRTSGNTITSNYYIYNDDGRITPLPTVQNSNYRVTAFCRKITKEGQDTVAMEIMDVDGKILKRMMYVVRDGVTIGRAASSIIDNSPVRCPNWEEEGYAYYLVYFSKNFADDYSGLQPYDEFWNKSVFVDGNNYLNLDFKDFQNQFFEGSKVKLKSHYWSQMTYPAEDVTNVEVPYLHILSRESLLYKGLSKPLRDGDRIMALGQWKFGMPASVLASEWKKLSTDGKDVTIEVLRKEGNALVPEKITVKGSAAEAARSEYHVYKLSKEELPIFKKYAKI